MSDSNPARSEVLRRALRLIAYWVVVGATVVAAVRVADRLPTLTSASWQVVAAGCAVVAGWIALAVAVLRSIRSSRRARRSERAVAVAASTDANADRLPGAQTEASSRGGPTQDAPVPPPRRDEPDATPWRPAVLVRLAGPVRIDGLTIRRRVTLETVASIAVLGADSVAADGSGHADLERVATWLDVTRRTATRRLEAVDERIVEATGRSGLVVEGDTVALRGDTIGSDLGLLRRGMLHRAPAADPGPGIEMVDDALSMVAGMAFANAVRTDDQTWPWLDDEQWPHTVTRWIRDGAVFSALHHLELGDQGRAERSCRAGLLASPEDPEILDVAARIERAELAERV